MYESFSYRMRIILTRVYWFIDAMVWILTRRLLPVPHLLKQYTITVIQRRYGIKTLVETGTYVGDMVEAQKNNFKKIISIELSHELAARAAQRFCNESHIKILQGDSSDKLKVVIKTLKTPALFWLDGHYSGGLTSCSSLYCPIWEELNTVFSSSSNIQHIILIDDADCFTGKNDYPTIEELAQFIKKKKLPYSLSISNNIIHLLPTS